MLKFNEIVVVFIRGDYEVNEAKLRKIVVDEVFPLADNENKSLCFGFIGPKDLNAEKGIRVIFDKSLENEKNLICGANKKDYHISGISIDRDIKIEQFFDVSKVNVMYGV